MLQPLLQPFAQKTSVKQYLLQRCNLQRVSVCPNASSSSSSSTSLPSCKISVHPARPMILSSHDSVSLTGAPKLHHFCTAVPSTVAHSRLRSGVNRTYPNLSEPIRTFNST